MEDNNIQDSCCNSKYASIRQMDKLDEMLGRRFPFYPRTVIQAVHDGRTGASLEAILAQYNNIYVQYQGTAGRTRNIVPKEMRRKGIIISYVDMQGNAITEKCVNDAQRDNFHWGLDVNWVRVDELTLSGDISVSVKGTWVINGEDTGIAALGPKGDNGLTPWLKTIDNKLHFSYDNETWEVCSDYIAAYFRFQDNKFQISRDNKTWSDLSGEVTNSLSIKAYVTDKSQYPNPKQGDMIMVGPTYEDDDTEHTKPIYHLNIYNAGGWVNNGPFQSINAGVVQELGDSETEVMSQKAVSEKFSELEETLSKYLLFNNVDVAKAVQEIYIPEEIFHKYPDGVYLWNIGKLRDGNITVQIYGLKSDGSNEKIVDGYYDDFGNVEKYTDNGAFIIDLSNLDQTAGAYQNIKIPLKKNVTIKEYSPIIYQKLSNNQWYGKKIIWLGTSVPYGQYATKSYALEAANRLGFNLINTSMPGQRIHGYYDEEHDVIMGGQGTIEEPTNAYATTLSKAEYIAAKEAGVSTAEIASSSSPWEPNKGGSSYTRTWENIFVEENADADLWVFDVAPNNTNFETTDWDLFDKENWRYTDDSDFSEHRLTFLGALLFLMNKMYELNPKARLVFVLGTTYAYNEGKSNLELVRNAWNVHIIDLWGKINTSLPSIKYLYSEYTGVDGGKKINRHPSTFGHEKMGQMLANELLLIS